FDPELAQRLYVDVDASQLEPAETAAEMSEELKGWRSTMDAVVKRNLISTDVRPVLVLAACNAQVRGSTLRYEAAPHRDALMNWKSPDDGAAWECEVSMGGEYDVELLYGCGKEEGGSTLEVQIGNEVLPVTVEETGNAENFAPHVIGRVKLEEGKWV